MSATTSDVPRWHRRQWAFFALGGLAVLAACAIVARNGTVSGPERAVFHAINDLPDWLYRPLWVCQQFGNLLVAAVLAIAVALWFRRPKVALGIVVAVGAKLLLERVVKQLVERQRPGTSIGDVTLHGSVPVSGLSFVSGHAVITAALATLLVPILPRRWQWLPWLIVALNGLARIYVGAHNPLDVVGGIGLGLFIGGLINVGIDPGAHRVARADSQIAAAAPAS